MAGSVVWTQTRELEIDLNQPFLHFQHNQELLRSEKAEKTSLYVPATSDPLPFSSNVVKLPFPTLPRR